MREILTVIAGLLCALLTAALAGPWLIDWNAHRDVVEAQLSKALGAPVTTRGAIDLKLLPSPRLVLGGAELAGARGFSLRSERVVLELAVAPLLRGEFRFIEASFEAADIQLDAVVGAPDFAAALPGDTQFERLVLKNARLRGAGEGGAALDIAGLELEAEAASLAGPFKGSGSFVREGERLAFRFSTGSRENDRMRVKFIADESAALPRADFDGVIVFAGMGGKTVFEGPAVFSGGAIAGWRLSGPLKMDFTGAAMETLDLKIGGEDQGLGFTGKGSAGFGRGARAELALAAKQIDADRWLGSKTAGGDWLGAASRGLADADFAGRAGLPFHLSVSALAMQLGGETLTDLALDARLAPGLPAQIRLEANGPGRSRLLLDGALETGAAAQFRGRAEAGARDVSRLADWLAQGSPEAASRLRALPVRALEVGGDAALSGAGFSARNFVLKVDRSTLRGAAAYTRALGAEPARVFADLTSESLDLDAVPDLSAAGAALEGMDFQLSLEARAVRVARFGEGMIDAGRIKIRASRAKAVTKLETFELAEIGGASFEAHGEAGPAAARLDGRLDAQRLGELAALLQRAAPSPWAQALASRATALSPARIGFSLEASRGRGNAGLRVDHLKLTGTARGTSMEATIRPEVDGNGLNGLLSLDAAEAPSLLRQLGFETLALAGAGRGRVSAEMRGGFETGLETTVLAQLAGAQLSFSGRAAGTAQSPDVRGQVRIKAPDAAPLMRVMMFGLPDFSMALPAEAGGGFSLAGGRARLEGITGLIGGSKISGDLNAAAEPESGGRVRVTGALSLDRLSLPALAGLVLGPPQTPRPGALWAETRFAAGLAEAPLADIAITAGEIGLGASSTGQNAVLRLRMAPGVLQIDDLAIQLSGAKIGGRLALRRDGANAAVSGALDVEGLRVDHRALSGLVSARMDFSSTGGHAAALAGGLAGGGSARVRGLAIAQADSQAPGRVISLADTGQIAVSENDFMGALRRELDKAPLKPGDQMFEATLANGVLRLAGREGISGALDLRNLALEARAVLTAAPVPGDWQGAAPQLAVVWKGPLASPVRVIEAGGFVNALAARAIAKESARVEALESDIRERAYFARRQRGLLFMRLREREIAAWEIEQAKLAAEEERRRLEEERRAAAEARRSETEAQRAVHTKGSMD